MSFRRSLLERAAARPRRVVLCEGDDPRVREVARFGGDVSGLVHPMVAEALAGRYRA